MPPDGMYQCYSCHQKCTDGGLLVSNHHVVMEGDVSRLLMSHRGELGNVIAEGEL